MSTSSDRLRLTREALRWQLWRASSDEAELEIGFWRGAETVTEVHLAEDDEKVEVALYVRMLRGRTPSGATAASAAFALADGLALNLSQPIGDREVFDVGDSRRRISAAVKASGEDAPLISLLDAGVPLWEIPPT